MNPRVKITREQLWRLLDGNPVQLQTPVGLLEVEGIENEWVPLTKLDPTPPHMIDAHRRMGLETELEVWQNETYEVIVTRGGRYRKSSGEAERDDEGFTHLSIKRYDRAPIRNWRHFQQMKNEICGDDAEGMEIYPRESRLADNANQYHVWVLPDDMDLPVGFATGCLAYDIRPMVCRLWGVVESMPCPYGCVPEGGHLPDSEGMSLLAEAMQIGGDYSSEDLALVKAMVHDPNALKQMKRYIKTGMDKERKRAQKRRT